MGNRWIQTFTGKQFDPIAPNPALIDIRDIAHALSNQCRYAGHVSEFYSVAEHSIHVAQVLEKNDLDSPKLWLSGLLHDSAEAYTTDIPRPIKGYVTGFEPIETRLLTVISRKFDFAFPFSPKLKFVDTSIILDEARTLFRPEWVESWDIAKTHKPLNKVIWALTPHEAESAFLAEYERIAECITRLYGVLNTVGNVPRIG